MPHQHLRMTELEGRATPASLTVVTNGVTLPPQDPMDNPPPVQPTPKENTEPVPTPTPPATTTFSVVTPTVAAATQTTTAYTPMALALLGQTD